MRADSEPDPNDEIEALTQALESTLFRAAEPRLGADFADRVIASIRQLEPEATVPLQGRSRLSFPRFSSLAAAFALSGILVFLGVNSRTGIQSDEEEWMAALSASNLTASDIPLIANLDELLEAELVTQLTSSWLESANP
jgi:hypothetical protein